MKRAIALLTAIITVLAVVFNAGAYADKNWPYFNKNKNTVNLKDYLFYEDFSNVSVGERPLGTVKYTEYQNTKISVVKDDKNESEKYLHLYDNNPSGDARVEIPLNTKKKKILLETKFKVTHPDEADILGFYIDFFGESKPLARISRTGTQSAKYLYYFSYNGVNQYPVQSNLKKNVWYECEILIDLESGTWDLQIVTDAFKGEILKNSGRLDPELGVAYIERLPLSPDEYQKGVSMVRFHTYGNIGSMYIDYIKVRDNVDSLKYKGKPPQKLELPVISPFTVTLPYTVPNVVYKGNILFFTIKPFVENKKVYAPLRTISSAYGFDLSFKDGIYTLSKEGYNVTVSKNDITVNEKILEGKNVIIKNGIYCISVVDFASAMGDTVTFDKDVIIE